MKLILIPLIIIIACISCRSNEKLIFQSEKAEETTSEEQPVRNEVISESFVTSNARLKVSEGVEVDLRVYEPDTDTFPGKRPTVLMVSSWALDKYEYEVQAKRFAARGFLVASVTPRGFGRSGGLVSAAGPTDQADLRKVLDWLQAEKPMDEKNVGVAGVSYGGGLALTLAALDPRIKTAVAINSWADLKESLYSQNTIHKDWVNVLVLSGAATGRLDLTIIEHINNVRQGKKVEEFSSWAAERSALHYLDALNEKKVPLFLGSSYEDALFGPNQMRSFYEKLSGPKRFYLDHGIHFSAQTPGLFGLTSDVWNEALHWMQHWLVDPTSDLPLGISMRSKYSKEFQGDFAALNEASEQVLTPRNKVADDSVSFFLGLDSGASSRILPFVSGILSSHFDLPVKVALKGIRQLHAAVYDTPAATEILRLRGAPRLQFTLDRHASPVTLVAYLYAVDANDIGTLVSHTVMSELEKSEELKTYELDFGLVSYDLPKGQHLAVVIDSVDPLYDSQRNLVPVVRLSAGEKGPQLRLPIYRP